MDDQIRETIRQKLGNAVSGSFPVLTRRDRVCQPLEGKARAVIGMRRAGKTSFLYQCLSDRLANGIERERLVYFNFEDDRLGALTGEDLSVILEEYYRAYPQFRRAARVTWCLDEIQVVPGWEGFVRRVMDEENVELFLSGSSARMLSREVATSMRGRALETVITPFSFREFARDRVVDWDSSKRLIAAAETSAWLARFDNYVKIGGFPEAGRMANERERISLLQGYVDSVLFRDVVERHGISNIVAMRAFVRQLMRQAATLFSVSKVHADFRSRGIGVSKETLLAMLAHLEDAFLVFTLPVASRSERRQQVNPRKLYLADHGLAQAYSPATGLDRGRLIENLVACELARQSRDLAYVKTESGYEVDFLTTEYDGTERLVQVASDISETNTFNREIRALTEAALEFPKAKKLLLTETNPPRNAIVPEDIHVMPVWRWLLGEV